MIVLVGIALTPWMLAALGVAALLIFLILFALFEPGMRLSLAISRAIDWVNESIGKLAAWAILAAILVSAANAVVRKAFNYSSNAYLEMQWYLFGVAFLLAAAYTLKQNEHIRVDIVYGMFRRRGQHWIDLLGHILFLMPFVALMVYYFGPWFLRAYNSGEVSSASGGLPLWPAKLLLLIGFIQLFAQGLSEIVKKIAIMRGKMDDPNPFISAHKAAEEEGKALAQELRT